MHVNRDIKQQTNMLSGIFQDDFGDFLRQRAKETKIATLKQEEVIGRWHSAPRLQYYLVYIVGIEYIVCFNGYQTRSCILINAYQEAGAFKNLQ